MDNVRAFFQFVFSHKLKYLVFLLGVIFFLFVVFPFQDLPDLITAQVSQQTNKQVYVQMKSLDFSVLTGLMVGAQGLSIDTPLMSGLNAQEVQVHPSIGALITQSPTGALIARGLFGGDVEIDIQPGKKTEAGAPTYQVNLKSQNLSLGEISRVGRLPLLLRGKVALQANGNMDPTLVQQPDFEITIDANQLEIPSLPLPQLYMSLPELRFQKVEIKGRLSAGRLNIERAQLGQAGDDLSATLKGWMDVQIRPQEPASRWMNSYNLEIDLNARPAFLSRYEALLIPVDQYKTSGNATEGARYQLRLTGNVNGAFEMSKLR